MERVMKPAEAVAVAKAYLAETFEAEGISRLALEEIDFDPDEGTWNITLGFLREAEQGLAVPPFLRSLAMHEGAVPRIYRVVKVRDADGSVASIKIRELAA